MRILVSYVIQDAKTHWHQSEIIEIKIPPYTFSADPPVSEVVKWAEMKQKELTTGQQLILTGMFNI